MTFKETQVWIKIEPKAEDVTSVPAPRSGTHSLEF
jgi:hypothetical protein